MPTTSQLLAFAVASLLFIQVPGPSLLFTIGRALTVGRRDTLLSVVGNGLGLVLQVVCVAVGLGALIAASTTAFTVLKVLGAGYVVYLGVQAIRNRGAARAALELDVAMERTPAWRSIRTGLMVGATNPKTIVFFAAFLPQFVNTGAPAAPQVVVLGVLFGVLAVLSDSVWALVAGKARTWFARHPQRLDALGATGGTMMIGLGAVLVFQGSGSAH